MQGLYRTVEQSRICWVWANCLAYHGTEMQVDLVHFSTKGIFNQQVLVLNKDLQSWLAKMLKIR